VTCREVLIVLSALPVLLGGCERPAPAPGQVSAPAPAWLAAWQTNAAPQFACERIQIDSAPDFPDSMMFPAATLRRFGAIQLVRTRWRDVVHDDSTPLTFCCASMPSDLHAFGLYQSTEEGVDQSALRGGPSKRLADALVIFKGRWVAWTEPENGLGAPLVAHEELFGKLCAALPGTRWHLPAAVAALTALDPVPVTIDFMPDGFLRSTAIGPVVTAVFRTDDGRAELFHAVPATRVHGAACFTDLSEKLAAAGVTAATVDAPDGTCLFAPSSPDGPLYVVLSDKGLCGVRGMRLDDARALVARWLDQ
jgi:hypothetical protein